MGGDLEMRRKKRRAEKSGESKQQRGEGLIEKERGYRVEEGEEEGSTVSTEKAMAVCNNKQCVRRGMLFLIKRY